MTFADNLRRLMDAKEISAYRLAKDAGISEALLSRLFRGGRANPSLDTAAKLAKVLGVPIESLVVQPEKKGK
jgi:transcriptional regulator with XRE-family HTH domain